MHDPHKILFHDRLLNYIMLPLVPRRVTPNAITMLRFVLTPLVVFLIWRENYLWGIPLFLFAAFTDAIDGSLARIRKKITEWGTLYDPIADKLLIGSVLVIIVLRNVNFYLGLLVIFIELTALVAALYYKSKGVVRPANIWGKIKMNLQVLGILMLLIALYSDIPLFVHFSAGTFALAVIFAIVSMIAHGIALS